MLFCWFISPTLLHNAMQKFGTFFRATQNTKVSCRRTALNHCNDMERCWNKNEVSLSSPDTLLILWPRAEIKYYYYYYINNNTITLTTVNMTTATPYLLASLTVRYPHWVTEKLSLLTYKCLQRRALVYIISQSRLRLAHDNQLVVPRTLNIYVRSSSVLYVRSGSWW